MKAIRVHGFGGPEVMKLEDVPELQPGPGRVLVSVRAAGVNPVDTYWRSGSNPQLTLPYTPGLDGAGLVESIGEGVTQFRPGDRVYVGGTVTGTYAAVVLCEASRVFSLPHTLTFAQGAAVAVPYGTAYRALFQRGLALAGETVLIHGASGGVGIAATQLARAAGLVTIGTAGTEAGRRLIQEQGAHHVLDHTRPGYLEDLTALTGGRGVNLILEMLANINLASDLRVLASKGRVVVIGSRGKIEITPRDAMSKDLDMRGMSLFNVTDSELAGIHSALRTGFENGTSRPVIRREMPLADAARAHELVLEPGAHGKIVLLP